jgi:hypothetical protein
VWQAQVPAAQTSEVQSAALARGGPRLRCEGRVEIIRSTQPPPSFNSERDNALRGPMPFSSQPVAGLTSKEAANRLALDGSNVLPGGTPKTFLAIVLGVVTEPMFLMLLVAGGVYLALGDRATKVHEFVPPIGRLGKNGVAPSPVELRVVAAA